MYVLLWSVHSLDHSVRPHLTRDPNTILRTTFWIALELELELELFIEAKRKRFVEPLSRFSGALASRVCISNPIAHRIRTPLFFPISCIFSLFLLAQPQIDPLSLKQEIRASLGDAFLIKLALMSEQWWLSQDFPYYHQNRYRLSGYHAILNEILWVFLGTKWAVDEINSR